MIVNIRTIGNSKGIVLPKPVLAQAGLAQEQAADLTVENGAIVLRKPRATPRAGWSEAAQALADQGGDALVMGNFANDADAECVWCNAERS